MGQADAALAASIFHFGEFTIAQVKQHMHERGIPVRTVAEPTRPLEAERNDGT